MKKKLIYSGMLTIGLFLSSSCTKNFDQLNTDPTAFSATNFDPNYLLTTAQLNYTGSQDFSYDTWRADLIYCSDMIQGTATSIGYWAGDKYLANPEYTAAYWQSDNGADGAYSEQVKNIVDMVSTTAGVAKYNNLYQIGRIMKALIFERITDLYGDVPYSQAGLAYYSGQLLPVYDKQQAIYTNLISELQDATAKLSTTGDIPTGDAFYHGNIAEWQKFGNSLLLRVAMRLSKVDPATAKTVVQTLIGKTMTSNADDAFLLHDPTGGRPTVNRVSQVLQGGPENTYVKWSKTFIDLLKNTNDPRLGFISVTNATIGVTGGDSNPADQKGQPNGYDLSGTPGLTLGSAPGFTSLGDYSSPSTYLTQLSSPTFVLTYGETELLWADAAERFSIGGSAATHYNNGVEAAITYLIEYGNSNATANALVSLPNAQAYVAANPYVAGETGLQMINTQYWELTNTMMDFYESWSNWRRTNYPTLVPVVYPGNATNGTIPRRFPYPLVEAENNPTNYTVAHNAVPGGDVLSGRVWWDPAP
jgi:Starch-binding associating with outer membrane